MGFMNFTFTDDYKTEFKDYVTALYKSEITEVEVKKEVIEILTESYFLHSGKVPESVQLDRLSTWLLKGENLTGDFHSEDQTRWRERKKETSVAEVFNDELALKREGHRVKKRHTPSDLDGDSSEYVISEYDLTSDKRKYNAPLRKVSQ